MLNKLLGNQNKSTLFVISAPAGTGKSTLVDKLIAEFPDEIAETCSHTTRKPRRNEISDKHYRFTTVEEFERRIDEGIFLEHAKVFGNYYGTEKNEVQRLSSEGKHAILVIDTQGAMKIKEKVDAIYIFITPPSLEELKRRLFKRQTEDEQTIQRRLEWAEKEMMMSSHYDYIITNEDLEISYQILRSIIIAEEHRRR